MADYGSMFDAAQGQTAPAGPEGTGYATMFDTAQAAPAQHEFGLTDTWPFRLARALPGLPEALYQSGKDLVTLPGDVYTGAQDLNDPNITARAMNAAAWLSPANPAFASGERAIAGVADAGTGSPTRQALYRSADKGYDTFVKSPVKIKPEAMKYYSDFVGQDLLNQGITPEQAPLTNGILTRLAVPPANSYMSTANYKALREALGRVAKSYNPTSPADQPAATIAIKTLDQHFNTMPQTGFMAGTAPDDVAAARSAYQNANGDYAAASRSGAVSTPVNDAEHAARAANSGQNIGNTIRRRMAGIIRGNDEFKAVSNKATKGFSPDELAAVANVADGTFPMNASRYAANLLGGGGGLGHTVGMMAGGLLGHMLGGGMEAAGAGAAVGAPAIGILGHGFKRLENALVQQKAAQLDEMLRARSPLAQRGATGPMSNTGAAIQAITPRALAIWQAQNPNSL